MSQEEHVASACRSRVNEQRAFPVTFGRNWITSFKQSLIRWSALWEIFPAIKLCCSCSKKHMKRCYLIYVWMNFPVILILILNINLLKWKTEIYFPATVSCFEDIPASWIFMRVMSHETFIYMRAKFNLVSLLRLFLRKHLYIKHKYSVDVNEYFFADDPAWRHQFLSMSDRNSWCISTLKEQLAQN